MEKKTYISPIARVHDFGTEGLLAQSPTFDNDVMGEGDGTQLSNKKGGIFGNEESSQGGMWSNMRKD